MKNAQAILLRLESVVTFPTPAVPAHMVWVRVSVLDAFNVLGACDSAVESLRPECWTYPPPLWRWAP